MRALFLVLILLSPALAARGIVVLGAAQWGGKPSPTFAARLDKAAELWRAGRAPVILVTGGRAPGARYAEGEVGCRYLEARGLPRDALLCETESRSTWENLLAAREVFGREPILLVTDRPHLPRALLYAKRLGLRAQGVAVEGKFRPRYLLRERLYYFLSLLFPELPASRRPPGPGSPGTPPASRGTAP